METPNIAAPSESRARYWLGVLRPLLWWLLLVLVLYGIRTHQRLMQQTRLAYSVALQGRPVDYEVSINLDGASFVSGQMLSLGRHEFTISHPKAKPFTTNLFIWYGPHDLGRIQLMRTKGDLAIQANPPAALLVIRGPEFSVTLTNSSGMTSSVPTDRYMVQAKYEHWQDQRELSGPTDATTAWRFAPRLGTIQITCSHPGATFQLTASDGRVIEQGEFPSVLSDYPEGNYKLIALRRGTRWEDRMPIKAGETNGLRVEFLYGGAVLESEPTGATVLNLEGREWGVTPLTLSELSVGKYKFNLRRDGYEPVQIALDIAANQTISFRTNLVNLKYSAALSAARRDIAAGDYDQALQAVVEAMNVKPDDPVAGALLPKITVGQNLRRATGLAQKGHYSDAVTELEAALKAQPDNVDVKALLTDCRPRAAEQAEQRRVARLTRGKELFDAVLLKHPAAELFDSHEIKTTRRVKEAQKAIIAALKAQPAFRIIKDATTGPETFEIEAIHEFTTLLDTSAGRRQCLIVGAQTRDDETQILFKVLEFKAQAKAEDKFSLGNLLGAPVSVDFVPIHPSRIPVMTEKLKAQVQEGMANVTERIQRAAGK